MRASSGRPRGTLAAMSTRSLVVLVSFLTAFLSGCASGARSGNGGSAPAPTGLSGHLLIIGGGLDDDNKPVYERFIALASPNGQTPRVVIATAASGDQEANAVGKTESIRAYCPAAKIDVIRRETSTDETVGLIDQATAMFFTGGDQKRIVDRYRPNGIDTPEAAAMRRLLERNGVIAGTSAGDAMMSDPMFHTGRSAEALGIRSTRTQRGEDDDADDKRPQSPLGPQIGPGMNLVPWIITDSHFFERHRFGRLVAALETGGKRLGLGVGEDACAEVDLTTGELTGISIADSLLVDIGAIKRDGLARRGVRARVIQQGTRISLTGLLAQPVDGLASPALPAVVAEEIPVVEPGQNRQLASWRFFTRAQIPGASPQSLRLDGYDQLGWPDGQGWSMVEITPQGRRP